VRYCADLVLPTKCVVTSSQRETHVKPAVVDAAVDVVVAAVVIGALTTVKSNFYWKKTSSRTCSELVPNKISVVW